MALGLLLLSALTRLWDVALSLALIAALLLGPSRRV
jgi:hypothetical protein